MSEKCIYNSTTEATENVGTNPLPTALFAVFLPTTAFKK